METYDKGKIGELISWGGEHFVYNYGEDKVIKFSSLFYIIGKDKALLKLEKDYKICQEFFGGYILQTEAMVSPNKKYFVQVQPKINGRFLYSKDLENEEIRKQFIEIIDSYNKMIKSGDPEVDLIGRGGVLNPCLSNIFVTDNNKLKIIDATLLSVEGFTFLRLYIFLLRKIVIYIQNRTIKLFINKINNHN
ncbi:TPA: hypothetical protein DCX66_04075 [Candidatus Nomurabacteria bacterium]|uniref:Uncharacterized protein n=1 Tax=Candidatus Nomurabacteria bacterium GW2011_GWE1_35_16 TaxID=1618761 RepID=A0A0G0BA40_9BACT|nr:MAG: hypothetical protein UR55_C0012G0027 [Candidatus Nomurabacteria bacterium GW2011_GWF1_34_20]KKP62806.1 MAG: hypothetical protein UR57_C0011G0025 [Candidatus Nomurabacteria bacterium GW2011_GWE2_34_25]KKP66204.1 MAG: hypothetical protein UR64_C0011G0026 [Candidatus Nomurabacteria bacterium GW2011_GWE1_35_16]HAE36239.1 hypothetical protein [Candidatus Nomurabacteria bacterium]HCT86567.1 hypothetical protein [Candidatus Margulisiibacteriota bacterium]